MSEKLRYPILDRFYQRYLDDEDSANFIRGVVGHYTIGSLRRLAQHGQVTSRRAAVMMIGFIGDFSENEIMGKALSDRDRAVRMLADNGIRDLWSRQGQPEEQLKLGRLYKLVTNHQMDQAILVANELIDLNPEIGDAWSQRAIAYCAKGDTIAAVEDCCEALNRNRYHFLAAIGMGHCCLQLDDNSGALSAFRLALQINPDLENVRTRIHQLERATGN